LFPLPRDLERQLKRMGLKVEEVRGVKLVVIEAEDREIMIEEPQVLVMTLKDQKIFQIIGARVREVKEEPSKGEGGISGISEEDVRFVAEQAGVTPEKAREALIRAGGDIARALMIIQEEASNKKAQ